MNMSDDNLALHGTWISVSTMSAISNSPETQAGAQAYEAVLRQRLARGEPIDGHKKTNVDLPRVAKEWLDTYARTNNKPSENQRADPSSTSRSFLGG